MAESLPVGLGRQAVAAGSPAPSREYAIPRVPPWLIIAAAVMVSSVAARFFADGRVKFGAALVVASLFGPLVFFDLAFAFALWVAVLFIQDLRALSIAPNTMGVLIGLGWFGAFAARAARLPAVRDHRKLILTTILFVLWLTLSIAWAHDPGRGASIAGFWWLAALALLITMTTLTTRREISAVAVALVAGAVVAAVVGLVGGGLFSASSQAGQTAIGGRLTGGGGDPNEQAAAFIAAMFLTMGLFSVFRGVLARAALLAAFILITTAFFATQSRGGLIALGVATAVSAFVSAGQRRRMLALITLATVIAAVAVAVQPGALGRITNFGGGTSGRSDVWRVATTIFEQHPLVGIGLDQFQVLEPHYALMPGTISRVNYIAEVPYLAHNTYLQLLAETGVIGCLGFIIVILICLRATWMAAQIFDRTGRRAYGDLARAALMGTIGFLSAIFFITDGEDWRLWVLLGLGPALLALARGGGPARPGRWFAR